MKVLGIIPKKSAVTTYRVIRPLEKIGGKIRMSLLRKNEKIKTELLAERLKKQGDIWVIKYIEDLNTANLIVWMRDKVGSKLVVDIDDNIWEIPFGNPTTDNMDLHVRRGFITTQLVQAADAVTVSTAPLWGKLHKLNENVVVIPNLIDPKDWKAPKKHDKIRIGWIYSHTHLPDVKEVKESLNKIKKEYGDKVEIVIFGSDLKVFDFEPEHHWGVKFDKYPERLAELGLDISVCPLEDNEFNKCKSNIKWMESSMAGAAVVASNVYPYEYSIKHGKTGYLAKNTNQFYKYIKWLIDNPDKRAEIVKNAQEVIKEKYNIHKDKSIEEFYKSL